MIDSIKAIGRHATNPMPDHQRKTEPGPSPDSGPAPPDRPENVRYQFPDIASFQLFNDERRQKTIQAIKPEPANTGPDRINPGIAFSTLRHIIYRSRQREHEKHKSIRESHQQQGYQAGFEEGRKTGWQSGYQASTDHHNHSAEKWTTLITDLWSELQDLHASTVTHLGNALLDLVTHVSRQVVSQELSTSRDAIKGLVDEAVKLLPGAIDCHLYINPEDRTILAPVIAQLPGLNIHEENDITPGGFRLVTDKGEMDATIQRRFETCLGTVHETIQEACQESFQETCQETCQETFQETLPTQ